MTGSEEGAQELFKYTNRRRNYTQLQQFL